MTSPKLGFLFRNSNVTFYGLSTFCYTLLLSTELTYILIVFLNCLRLDRISQTESFFSTWLPSVGHTFPPESPLMSVASSGTHVAFPLPVRLFNTQLGFQKVHILASLTLFTCLQSLWASVRQDRMRMFLSHFTFKEHFFS